MSEGGMVYLILVCVVFLIYVGVLMRGMLVAGNLPHETDAPAAGHDHHHAH